MDSAGVVEGESGIRSDGWTWTPSFMVEWMPQRTVKVNGESSVVTLSLVPAFFTLVTKVTMVTFVPLFRGRGKKQKHFRVSGKNHDSHSQSFSPLSSSGHPPFLFRPPLPARAVLVAADTSAPITVQQLVSPILITYA